MCDDSTIRNIVRTTKEHAFVRIRSFVSKSFLVIVQEETVIDGFRVNTPIFENENNQTNLGTRSTAPFFAPLGLVPALVDPLLAPETTSSVDVVVNVVALDRTTNDLVDT